MAIEASSGIRAAILPKRTREGAAGMTARSDPAFAMLFPGRRRPEERGSWFISLRLHKRQ